MKKAARNGETRSSGFSGALIIACCPVYDGILPNVVSRHPLFFFGPRDRISRPALKALYGSKTCPAQTLTKPGHLALDTALFRLNPNERD